MMKTKSVKQNILINLHAAVADIQEERQFRLWFDHHAMREFEKWKRRNQYNKPPVDFNVVTGNKKMSG